MFIDEPERRSYLDNVTYKNAMQIWHEEEPLRKANINKSLKQKVTEALTPEMISALSDRQLDIIDRQVSKDVDDYGNKVTPEMILGSYELVVTLIWPEPATDKYADSSLHFP